MRKAKEFVLLADDDKEILAAVSLGLERNFIVTTVENGYEAIKEIESNPKLFDCIISDFQMPKATGEAVANCCAKYRLPCVVVSGDHSRRDIFTTMPVVFLAKPYSADELLGAIRQAQECYNDEA